MLSFPLGLAYSNMVEWVVHKYLLHGLGKRKGSVFSFHWHSHHKHCRRNGNSDPGYKLGILNRDSRIKEVLGVAALVAVHVPLAAVSPWFAAGIVVGGLTYLHRHKKAHVDVEWGKRHMPWHYDHHMGKDQDANWCVTFPWFDWVMGTRCKAA